MMTDADILPHRSTRWELADAHVVVLLDNGGMKSMHDLALEVEEGRDEDVPEADGGAIGAAMRYFCAIRIQGTTTPDAWAGSGAIATIIGKAGDGTTIAMGGRCLFGHADEGTFEIEFDAPPSMTTWSKPGRFTTGEP